LRGQGCGDFAAYGDGYRVDGSVVPVMWLGCARSDRVLGDASGRGHAVSVELSRNEITKRSALSGGSGLLGSMKISRFPCFAKQNKRALLQLCKIYAVAVGLINYATN